MQKLLDEKELNLEEASEAVLLNLTTAGNCKGSKFFGQNIQKESGRKP